MITVEHLRELVSYDSATGDLTWLPRRSLKCWNVRNAGRPAGRIDVKGYRRLLIEGRAYLAHRIAIALSTGHWPSDSVDHLNGDRADNRLANLREATVAENARNTAIRSDNKSGVTGVHFYRPTGRWVAQINDGQRLRHIGYFDDIDDAAHARKAAECRLGYHENHGRAPVALQHGSLRVSH